MMMILIGIMELHLLQLMSFKKGKKLYYKLQVKNTEATTVTYLGSLDAIL
jgi:hypothetical protein